MPSITAEPVHSAAGAGFPPAPPSPSSTGFQFVLDGETFDSAQLVAAIRCAREIYTAYARTRPELGGGSRSVCWNSLDAAAAFGRDALDPKQRLRADAECVAENNGIAQEGGEIVITTEGDLHALEVTGCSIPDTHLRMLLAVHRVLRVQNQIGVALDVYFDMDGETLVAALPDATKESAAAPDEEKHRYSFEFPDFGKLDVELPEGFIDQSWHKNTCPSFELPNPDDNAEWPLLTIFIDYLKEEDRMEVGELRFNVYVGEGLSTGDARLRTDVWAEVLECVATERAVIGA